MEPTERELNKTLSDSMDLFRRAQVGEVAAIVPRRAQKLLLVLDGSNQDELSLALTRSLQQRFAAAVDVIDARETDAADDLAPRAAQALSASALKKCPGDSYEQILAAAEKSGSDLIVVPCPHGRDLERVGPDSAGTVIDVLLARSPVPILVVRRPFQPQGDPFSRVRLILWSENEIAPHAAAWAAGLAAPAGDLRLVLVLEPEFRESVQAILATLAPDVNLAPEQFTSALARCYARLHRALQKTAAAQGFSYDLELHAEEEPALDVEAAGPRPISVLPLERADHASLGHVERRVRLSPYPVLVVSQA